MSKSAVTSILITLVVALAGCDAGKQPSTSASSAPTAATAALEVTSSSFAPKGEIPAKHTCEGSDTSPQLSWKGAPPATKSFALVVDDPDAPDPDNPKTTWVHWVLYDIPASTTSLDEGIGSLPAGTREGKNDWKKTGFGGPCPPVGRHRYFHKIYALDTSLGDLGEPTKAHLDEAMQGHVLAMGQLVGTYEKAKK